MAIDETNNITLSGLDWSDQPRDIDLDRQLWHKICHWRGDETGALDWVRTQIALFSKRHKDRRGLSQIISSIAFVEMVNPIAPSYLFHPMRSGHHQDSLEQPCEQLRTAAEN